MLKCKFTSDLLFKEYFSKEKNIQANIIFKTFLEKMPSSNFMKQNYGVDFKRSCGTNYEINNKFFTVRTFNKKMEVSYLTEKQQIQIDYLYTQNSGKYYNIIYNSPSLTEINNYIILQAPIYGYLYSDEIKSPLLVQEDPSDLYLCISHTPYNFENKTIYIVPMRSQIFELAALIITKNIISDDFSMEFFEQFNENTIYDNKKTQIFEVILNINGMSIPIIEEIDTNKFIFYKHNFKQFQNEIKDKFKI